MLSDGRIVGVLLAKVSCLVCGSVSHAAASSAEIVRATYNSDYTLGETISASELQRGSSFASFILDVVHVPEDARILDVGCGAGTLLKAMGDRLSHATLCGIEAAARLVKFRDPRVTIYRAFVEDLEPHEEGYDLVCSINVIEHSFDPFQFMRALAQQVAPGGHAAIICPRADQPNLELLFLDHMQSLPRTMLERLGRAAGLSPRSYALTPPPLGDFQMMVFEKSLASVSADRAEADSAAAAQALAAARHSYLEAWAALDGALRAVVPADELVACFGAGEAAALLRAYAPGAWAAIDALLVDQPAAASPLGPPICAYRDNHERYRRIMIGIHPARQGPVAARLLADGHIPIPWPGISR